MTGRIVLLVLGVAAPVAAQPVTLAFFAPSVIDANTAVPVAAPVTMTPTCGVTPKWVETPAPVVNPPVGAYDDPADTTRDCRVALPLSGLRAGTYTVAHRWGTGRYSVVSTVFTIQATGCVEGATTYPTGTERQFRIPPGTLTASGESVAVRTRVWALKAAGWTVQYPAISSTYTWIVATCAR